MKYLIAIFILAAIPSFSFGQLEVSEEPREMSSGLENSFILKLPETKKKVAIEVWTKFLKPYKGKRTKDTKSLLFTDDAKIQSFSANTTDLYAKFIEYGEENYTECMVWFDLGGAFLSSELHPDKMDAANEMFDNYFKAVKIRNAEDNLAFEENNLKDLEKEMNRLMKQKEDYEGKIKDAEDLIAEMNKKIAENEGLQEAISSEIKSQMKEVDDARIALQKVQ